MALYTHWVCFDCRKSFKYFRSTRGRKCTECRESMCDMGIYFEPPRRHASKAWAIMELLSINGYRFHSEGSKAFISSFVLGGRSGIKEVRRRIALERQETEEDVVKSRLRRHKQEKQRRLS